MPKMDNFSCCIEFFFFFLYKINGNVLCKSRAGNEQFSDCTFEHARNIGQKYFDDLYFLIFFLILNSLKI